MLQRTLGAKDQRNAQLGMLLGGFLKIVAMFLLIFPGIIALKLVPGIEPDRAYPALVQTVLPVGISGIVLAGFLAALMSSLDSSLMSLSSVLTIEIYPLFDKNVSERKALRVGRIAATTLLVWGIFAAPMIQSMGLIYPLAMRIGVFLMASIGVCYFVGRFSRRVNFLGALITLSTGLLAGIILVPLTTVPYLKPFCPEILLSTNYFHISGVLVLIYTTVLLATSYLAPAPSAEKLAFLYPPTDAVSPKKSERISFLRSFRFWIYIYIGLFIAVVWLF
jgi:SSS family solute:Na+ symporter